ncbi:hypothetical protein C0J52_19992 [Blattella germanica]|nr:hypothetical protein C0J52_19992 [Blattella germanica]
MLPIWGHSFNYLINPLEILQKRAIRSLYNLIYILVPHLLFFMYILIPYHLKT